MAQHCVAADANAAVSRPGSGSCAGGVAGELRRQTAEAFL